MARSKKWFQWHVMMQMDNKFESNQLGESHGLVKHSVNTKQVCRMHPQSSNQIGLYLKNAPYRKINLWFGPWQEKTVPRRYFFVDHLCYLSLVFVMLSRLFIAALWSPAGKGLTSWLLFVMSNCDYVIFHVVSWVRCGTWLYWSLIFAVFLTLLHANNRATDQSKHPHSLHQLL